MFEVFVQSEAGESVKRSYDEKSLEYLGTSPLSRTYPFPYGFVLNTTSEDGDNLDCFIITRRQLKHGTVVACEAAGLLEQLEDGLVDHNILAVLPDERHPLDATVEQMLRDFILHVFDHLPGKRIEVGRMLPVRAALRLLESCADLDIRGA
jgi:inorganic pyrophosphatase